MLRFVLLLAAWGLLATAAKAGPGAAAAAASRIMIPWVVLILVAHGVSTFRGLQVLLGTSLSPLQTARGHVSGNTITGLPNGFATGIAVGVADNAGSTMIAAVENNLFTAMGTMAIDANKQPLNSNMHVTVRNNTVRSPVIPGVNYLYGIRLTMASSSLAGPAGTYCANVTGNDIPSFGAGEAAVRIRRLGTHAGLTTSFQGFTGNTEGQLTTFLTNANTGPFGSINYSPAPLTQFAFPNTTCMTP